MVKPIGRSWSQVSLQQELMIRIQPVERAKMKRIIILAAAACSFNVEARPFTAATPQKNVNARNKATVEFPEDFVEIGKLRDRAIYKFVELAIFKAITKR